MGPSPALEVKLEFALLVVKLVRSARSVGFARLVGFARSLGLMGSAKPLS